MIRGGGQHRMRKGDEKSLEKEYFNKIYKPTWRIEETPTEEQGGGGVGWTVTEAVVDHGHDHAINLNLLNLEQHRPLSSVSHQSASSTNSLRTDDSLFAGYHRANSYYLDRSTIGNNSSVVYMNEEDDDLTSLRRLGFESVSICSLSNIRTNSYLKSRDNDCIDTILIQMEPKKEATTAPAPPPPPPPNTQAVKEEPGAKSNCATRCLGCVNKFKLDAIELQSRYYLMWLGLVAAAYIYNVVGISFRYSFDQDHLNSTFELVNIFDCHLKSADNSSTNSTINQQICSRITVPTVAYWMLADYVSDLVYLVDVFIVQSRIQFLKDGLWQSDFTLTAKYYFKSWQFVLDLLSILPTDLIQLVIGMFALSRVNRWLKLHSLWEFYDRWDRSVESYVFLVRLIRLLTYLMIVIHLYACTYFSLSWWEKEKLHVNNDWVFDSEKIHINDYIYSFLFGLKTVSTIGNNPLPVTELEFIYTALAYLLSMFLFSLIVGQIRNIIGSLSTEQDEFLIVVDTTVKYLKSLSLPDHLMKRVSMWFDYYAKVQDAIPFEAISFLPINVQTDLAITVYYDLLSKVKLFQECEKNLLYALVLKLKPIVFMPGDYICKKGDVGREMFIVDQGIIEVVVEGRGAVAQMKEGSYFGEISLLSMGDGGNRRTANVVSRGFSKLLVLHKSDLNEVLKSYPGMEEILRKAADSYLKKK